MLQGTRNETGYRTFPATAATIPVGTVVQLNTSGNILAATALTNAIGVVVEDVAASDYGTVQLFTRTFLMIAAAAITVGSELYLTASGQVTSSSGAAAGIPFIALESAAEQGDVFECCPVLTQAIQAGASQAAVVTTAPTNASPYGYSTSAQAAAIVTLVNSLQSALVTAGIIKGAA